MNNRLKQLKEWLNADPHDSFLLFAIAKEYDGLENFRAAISHFDKLRCSDPNYVGLYYHFAQVYIKLEDLENAMKIFNEGIKIATDLKDQHALAELKNAKMNLELGL